VYDAEPPAGTANNDNNTDGDTVGANENDKTANENDEDASVNNFASVTEGLLSQNHFRSISSDIKTLCFLNTFLGF
jgi:hypothetical protein